MKITTTNSPRKAVVAGLLGSLALAAAFTAPSQSALAVDDVVDSEAAAQAETVYNGWSSDKSRWYDDGQMATEHAFYDPESREWYWADADGSIAKGKDVYIPRDESKKNADGTWADTNGKWVRVDESGVMLKGLSDNHGNYYYFDEITGEMYHGEHLLDSSIWHGDPTVKQGLSWYHFDEVTGVMDRDKDVYIGSNGGKWCRYDENGCMVHGEDYRQSKDDGQMHWWYFDDVTGAMAKGLNTRYVKSAGENKTYYYDEVMGWMLYGTQWVNGTPMVFDSVFGWYTGNGGYAGSSSAVSYTNKTVKKLLETAESLESKNSGLWYGSTVTVQPHNTQLRLTCDAFVAYVHYLCDVQAWDSWGGSDWWNDSSFNAQIKWVKSLGNLKYNINELEPGDIVFYGTSETNLRHAAIYKGNGVIIHSADKSSGITEGPVSDLNDFVAGGSAMKK
ncbi:NlpC/P60 family protein [Paratractidigestivibacter sp.]|uniref:NlpC/P60 family protein n=1 Tax=Paratractidigestivibacter sp. TaxID=2847316 RepID=UPI002AC9C7B3|nr:NlpC/P60 family protein [Paratractidigestivibacter sp.]